MGDCHGISTTMFIIRNKAVILVLYFLFLISLVVRTSRARRGEGVRYIPLPDVILGSFKCPGPYGSEGMKKE